MRAISRQAWLLLLLAGCAEEGGGASGGGAGGAPAPACAFDADCPVGEHCEAGLCLSDVAVPCVTERDPSCGGDGLCVVNPASFCEGEAECFAATSCARPVGERGGTFGCTQDADCRSNVCFEGLCAQLCQDDDACDGVPCLTVTLPRGARTKLCVAADDTGQPDLAATRCEVDRDCRAGTLCRRPDGDPYGDDIAPRCAPIDPAKLPAGAGCATYADANPLTTGTPEALAADASCAANACDTTCLTGPGVCTTGRCSTPCRVDGDCPDRLICLNLTDEAASPVRPVHYCALSAGGCLSEEDCCPAVNERGDCTNGWSTARFHCRPVLLGPKMITSCVGEPPAAPPGAPCERDEACASAACLPGRTPADVKRCGFVCEPQRDVCAAMTGDPASTCGAVELAVGDATFSVPYCR